MNQIKVRVFEVVQRAVSDGVDLALNEATPGTQREELHKLVVDKVLAELAEVVDLDTGA